MSYNQKKFLDYDGLIHLLKKFDDYPTNDILGTVIDSIGAAIDAKVSDVQVNGTSIVSNGAANIQAGSGLQIVDGKIATNKASDDIIKTAVHNYRPIVPANQHTAVFYGLTKAAGVNMYGSSNPVGTYTDEAKAAIQTMLDVPSNATVTSAIGTAIGNVHQFSIEVVQALPTENIQEHTVYFVPKTGETNDIYDEYVYVNNGWEMIGNTQIDLSNYVQKTDYATASTAGVVKVSTGLAINSYGNLYVRTPTDASIQTGTSTQHFITPANQHQSTFYGLAKAAGDTTQSQSDNAIGTYTTEAKVAIQNMLGVTDALAVKLDAAEAGLRVVRLI